MFVAYTSTILIILIFVSMFMGGNSSDKARAPFFGRSYAHRGLFSEDQSVPENSLAAFAAAIRAGYGITADVQLTQDRRAVIFNDGHLTRMCGINLKVSDVTYEDLQALTLAGSEERIPLLSELLALVDGQVPIILYLRPCADNSTLCKVVSESMLAYEGPIAMASVAPSIVGWFKDRKQTKKLLRGSISAPRETFPQGHNLHYFLVSHGMLNSLGRPQFIIWPDVKKNLTMRGSISLGAMGVAGTIVGEEACTRLMETNDMIIFEHAAPPVKFKEPHDLAAMTAEYEARKARNANRENTLIDAYIDTVEEDLEADDDDAPELDTALPALENE